MNIKTIAGNKIKTALFLIIIFTGKSTGLLAQSQNWWRVNGNTPTSSDFLGTTNNQSIFIRTNNITRFTFGSNGDIIFNSLGTGSSNRVLSIDASGKLSALSGTAVTSLFSSNGVGVLTQTGNDYFLPSGNLGIGIAPSPGFKLDVIGDVRISNNLLVGGGIVITDKVQAATQIKGFDVKVDHDLNVTGSASFTGAATFKGGIASPNLGGAGSGLVYADAQGNLFKPDPFCPTCPPPPPTNMCVPGAWPWFEGGNVNVVNNDIGTCQNTPFILKANNKKSLFIEPGFGYIGIGENNSTPTAVIDIIDASSQGGNILTGNHTKIYGNVNGDIETNGQMTLRYNPNSGFFVAPNFASSNNSVPNFLIKNGQTIISGQGLPAGSDVLIITNDPNNINSTNTNFKVKSDGIVYTRELNVQLTNFPDYVFNKNYKLMNIVNLERYISVNKHLPNVPSASEIEKNGANIGALCKIQMEKIEELTLYVIELNKLISEQNKVIKELQNDLNHKK